MVTFRYATATKAPALEALQRRSSDVWEAYRDQLAANPDAIELPQIFIDNGWVRVAIADDETAILIGTTQTRFGPAVRMRRSLQGDQPRDAAVSG